MSRKKDPVVSVLAFFSDAELPVATTVLGIVKAIVQKRQPVTKAKRVRGPNKLKTVAVEKPRAVGPSEVALPTTAAPTGKAPAAEAKAPRRRTGIPATPPAPVKTEQDLKLPGIGPATVGE
jgi:hypothetical protein